MAQDGETFELIRGVTSLDVTDMVNYSLLQFDGLGMAPVHRLTQRGALQNGESDIGYRLDPRIITMILAGYGSSQTELHDRRAEIIGMLKPGASTDPVKIRWTFPDGTKRQIDCHFRDQLTLPSVDWRYRHHKIAFTLQAPDPTWYDPTGGSVTFAVGGGGTGFAFPLAVPMSFGASTLDIYQTITLDGDNAWDTYPIIYVTGAVTNLVLTNTATGDVLDFTGNTVGGGVTYTIDLRYGAKTVIDSSGVNRVNELTTSSDLATWRLVPGVNSIHAVGASITSATSILVQYNQRFIGV